MIQNIKLELQENSIKTFYNKVFNCDNKEIFSLLPDNSIDLIVTDPPYKDYQSNRPIANPKQKKIIESDFNLPHFISQSARVLKEGAHFYCWCDHFTFSRIFQEIANNTVLKYKNCLIWVKNNHGSGDLKGDYAPQHEFIIYAVKGKGKPLNGKRKPNVFYKVGKYGIEFFKKVPNPKFKHGTSKPVEILKLLVESSSAENDLVFDPYAGSMSLGEACILKKRNFLLVEIDKDNFTNGIERLKSISISLNFKGAL
ncbi:hypothetical protein ISS30_01310 [bacterium]|nr:hypothetical protein [bacterium]